jgi:asparagine synthase (glutamine-hydrolysing)
MFSFALYDTQEKVLTLARDRLGIKPLFYSAKNGTVTFASELKCFGKPEPTAASVFAMLLGVPTLCPETPWKGVQEVEPGHCITFRIGGSATVVATSRAWISLGEMISERYYSELNRLKPHDYNELFHNTFLASLHRTMLSDVGIGIGVSGGIDSSLIVAGSASIGRRIPLFHAEVTGLESEITHAQSISEQFSCQFYATPVDPDSYRAYLPELTWVNDFPLGYHNNSVPFALMARDASKHVKVLLTGEGADELNGGYDWPANAIQNKRTVACLRRFTAILKRLHLNGLEKLIRHFSLDLVSNNNTLAEFQTLLGGFHEALWECKGKEAYAFVGNEWERQTQARYFATSMGHLQSLLWRNDRMGMFASIESRFPFLDNELLALQLNTPMRFKRCRGNNKMAIRASASRCGVNSQLANRPKYGFTVNPSSHCSVDRSFFKDGFLVDFLPEIISAGQPKDWDTFYFYQVAVEVWGRIFCLGQPLSLVQATLCSASEKLSSERQGE